VPATVSVIVPCYNASRFLRETLDCALAQTHPPLEIIVIDDGSTDDSAEIAHACGPPVRVISQTNQGESVARNRGIDEARGDWIAFLDADDLWKPHKLQKQLAMVAPEVVAVHNNLYYFGDKQGETRIQSIAPEIRYSLAYLAASNVFKGPGSTLLVRRESSPRFPTWTSYGEDHVYCLELVRRGAIRLVEEPLTGYRQHSAAQSRAAATRIGWHQMIERWVEDNRQDLASEDADVIRDRWLGKLVNAALVYKSERRWSEYWKIRDYLAPYRSRPGIERLYQSRVYPPWLYAAWDQSVGRIRAALKTS
jgi:glycosyltransferase involved in cell wall biosynthesis